MRLLTNGMKIGNATVIVDIVDGPNREIRPRTKMNPRFLTDHDTGNSGKGADAKSHNRYIHNLGDKLPRDTSHISWHVTVDENYIIQHIPFDECAYHCGDGWLLTSGNRSSIGVEKCMHRGADRNKIEANAIALHAYLMKEFKLPITSVRPHQAWSGKYCPQLILNKYGSFLPFRNKIQAAFKGGPVIVKPAANRTYYLNGDNGSQITKIQEGLKKAGYKIVTDGWFGDDTEKVVKAFQLGNNLDDDGIWGAASQAKLDAIIANMNKPKPVAPKPAAPKPIIEIEEDEIMDLTQWQKEEIRNIYKKAREEDVFTDDKHEKNIMNGTMTTSYAVYLMTVIAGAAFNNGKRIK